MKFSHSLTVLLSKDEGKIPLAKDTETVLLSKDEGKVPLSKDTETILLCKDEGKAPLSKDTETVLLPNGRQGEILVRQENRPPVSDEEEQNEKFKLFTTENKAVEIEVLAVPCEEWKLVQNSADIPPASPVYIDTNECIKLSLVPYGTTMLRVSQFPWGVSKR